MNCSRKKPKYAASGPLGPTDEKNGDRTIRGLMPGGAESYAKAKADLRAQRSERRYRALIAKMLQRREWPLSL